MNDRLTALREKTRALKHDPDRVEIDWPASLALDPADSRCARAARCFCAVLAEEARRARILPGERIVLTRGVKNLPRRYTEAETARMREDAYFHELGVVFNLTVDYPRALSMGLDAIRAEALARRAAAESLRDAEGVDFLDAAISELDAVLALADAYRAEALRLGETEIAERLGRVPRRPPRTFAEALQAVRILHFCLWCEGTYHNGVGRIDQYLMPYLQADLDAGRLTEEDALEWLTEFFLTFNRDSGLYVGVQQGDNGQSLMLGGCDAKGRDASNLLTRLALKASGELKLIDPKINLRITKETPLDLLEEAAQLTRLGLGFPQYANDDVVIPGLVDLGYDLEDARDYTVAACWEFVIPGVGMDIPNIDAVSFPAAVDAILRSDEAKAAPDFDAFFALMRGRLSAEADRIEKRLTRVDMLPCPFTSSLCRGPVAAARDLSAGGKYNNFGIHGTGFAPAVDSLAAIRKLVYEERSASLGELIRAVDTDFADNAPLLAKARRAPKLGLDPEADDISAALLKWFADSWAGRKNCRGGIFRAGTGSAMYYVRHPLEIPTSCDGRLRGEPFPANYAPSLGVAVKGPISVINAFTKPDLRRVVNGGPLTIELHDSLFRSPEAVRKTARMVRWFAERGGHQLQLNTINRDTLVDAQKRPELYRHLIVRVWGWSGYFVELDAPYQNQIIKRAEMLL